MKAIEFAEKNIKELLDSGDLKELSETMCHQISKFYEDKSKSRLESAKLIYDASNKSLDYKDYGEVVSAAYYSMYYIVHSFIAKSYKIKLREGLRGVHSITKNLILYYLVKTNKLAKHLYEEYLTTLESTALIQKLNIEDFQEEAHSYAEKYEKARTSREIFTYSSNTSVEERHAKKSLEIAGEFINTVRQVMI